MVSGAASTVEKLSTVQPTLRPRTAEEKTVIMVTDNMYMLENVFLRYESCQQAASQVGHTATDGSATTLAIHCWTLSICCAQPHSLELLAGRPPHTAGL